MDPLQVRFVITVVVWTSPHPLQVISQVISRVTSPTLLITDRHIPFKNTSLRSFQSQGHPVVTGGTGHKQLSMESRVAEHQEQSASLIVYVTLGKSSFPQAFRVLLLYENDAIHLSELVRIKWGNTHTAWNMAIPQSISFSLYERVYNYPHHHPCLPCKFTGKNSGPGVRYLR